MCLGFKKSSRVQTKSWNNIKNIVQEEIVRTPFWRKMNQYLLDKFFSSTFIFKAVLSKFSITSF